MTRDPEWDDHERDKLLAWSLYQSQMCDCGLHKSTADEDPDVELAHRVCPVCAGIAAQLRILSDAEERDLRRYGTDGPPPGAPRLTDGRKNFLRFKRTDDDTAGGGAT